MATAKAKTETVPDVPEAIDFGPEGWRPEPGQTVTGKVLDLTTGGDASEYGRYPIVVLSTKDGDVAVHAFHHTLKNRLREMRPKRGHTLSITFHGMVEQTDRNGDPVYARDGEVKRLAMYTADSPEFEFNWDSF